MNLVTTLRQLALAATLAAACAAPAAAAPVFFDDFSADALALNANPLQWTVSDGTVDVVGTGFFANLCAGGPSPSRCVDLDGSSGNAGIMTSNAFNLSAGTYALSFWLAGNQRNGSDDTVDVSVTLPTLVSQQYQLASNAVWTQYTLNFVYGGVLAPFSIVFNHAGGDNIGIVLDNVSLEAVTTAVPEPGAMLLLGAAALGTARRVRRRYVRV